MKSYRVTTGHGPLLFIGRGRRWVIAAPARPPEAFFGVVPMDCLRGARRLSVVEACDILGEDPLRLWRTVTRHQRETK
jgi:hypothetical protein